MTGFGVVDALSIEEAVALLRQPHVQALASGADLLGLLKDGVRGPALEPPQRLVNLASVPGLSEVCRTQDGGWRLGAMVTLAQLARTPHLPAIVGEAVAHIASPQLRSRSTLGGNLLQRPRCLYFRHPDEPCFKKGGIGCPAVAGPPQAYPGALMPGPCHAGHPSDLAPVLIVLDAQAELHGPRGKRLLALAALFDGAAQDPKREAALHDGELLCHLHLPPCDDALGHAKVAPRDANEFATASAAVALRVGGDGRRVELRAALGGVAPHPLVVPMPGGLTLDLLDPQALARAALPDPGRMPYRQRLPAARLALERALQRALERLRTATT